MLHINRYTEENLENMIELITEAVNFLALKKKHQGFTSLMPEGPMPFLPQAYFYECLPKSPVFSFLLFVYGFIISTTTKRHIKHMLL